VVATLTQFGCLPQFLGGAATEIVETANGGWLIVTEISDMYGRKRSEYFGQVRTEILPLLPDRVGRVLEIGCGSGETLAYLKKIGICD